MYIVRWYKFDFKKCINWIPKIVMIIYTQPDSKDFFNFNQKASFNLYFTYFRHVNLQKSKSVM